MGTCERDIPRCRGRGVVERRLERNVVRANRDRCRSTAAHARQVSRRQVVQTRIAEARAKWERIAGTEVVHANKRPAATPTRQLKSDRSGVERRVGEDGIGRAQGADPQSDCDDHQATRTERHHVFLAPHRRSLEYPRLAAGAVGCQESAEARPRTHQLFGVSDSALSNPGGIQTCRLTWVFETSR